MCTDKDGNSKPEPHLEECVRHASIMPNDLDIAQLSQEEAVVMLFRPGSSGAATPMIEEQKGKLRALADECVVQMQDRVHTPSISENDLKGRFSDFQIPQMPMSLSEYVESIAPCFVTDSTRVANSRQIGHMTCSLPQYLPPLAEVVTALHQNVVKVETSKTVTLLEKQVMARLHKLIYDRHDAFYQDALNNNDATMGMFTSGGTIANITGLWVARNSALGPDPANGFEGIEQCGLLPAAMHYGYTGAVVIGSSVLHYSMKKAVDLLGLGVRGLVTVDYDEQYRVKVEDVEQKLEECKLKKVCVVAIVAVAGGTETGSVDDITALADLAERFNTHLHVDAAWGGPCLFSKELSPIMAGIDRADSVTIDGHKQLFMPMGCGMLALKDPSQALLVSKTASYIIRAGSSDLGKFTLEGSRPSSAVYMHANLCCIGAQGYEVLMNRSARVCRYMADTLAKHPSFEILFQPMTNILLYRYVPAHLRASLFCENGAPVMTDASWAELDDANSALQEQQKSDGLTFVSRTTVFDFRHQRRLVALRIVIGNPITEESDVDAVIADQLRIANGEPAPAPEENLSPNHHGGQEQTPEQYWSAYWDRMPEAARLFFLNDRERFRSTLVAPVAPSALVKF